MNKHSPIPWHIGLKPGPYVYGSSGEEIADCRGIVLEDEDIGTPENKANAAFIVKAVNCHEELLATLKELNTINLTLLGYYGNLIDLRVVGDEFGGYRERVEQAIAKAEAE